MNKVNSPVYFCLTESLKSLYRVEFCRQKIQYSRDKSVSQILLQAEEIEDLLKSK